MARKRCVRMGRKRRLAKTASATTVTVFGRQFETVNHLNGNPLFAALDEKTVCRISETNHPDGIKLVMQRPMSEKVFEHLLPRFESGDLRFLDIDRFPLLRNSGKKGIVVANDY